MINVARDARIAKMGQPLLRMSWMRAVCFWGFWRTHCQAVHLKSFKIKAILLNLESQYMSEHNPTLSLILSEIFSCLFNFKPFGQDVLWIDKKTVYEEETENKSRSQAFMLITKPQIKMKEKQCVQSQTKIFQVSSEWPSFPTISRTKS